MTVFSTKYQNCSKCDFRWANGRTINSWWHHNLKLQTLVDQCTTRVFKFLVDAFGAGFFNDHIVNALQTLDHLKTITKGFI